MTTQPIPNGPAVTADAFGRATFAFPPTAAGETWDGTLSVPGAPGWASFVANAQGQPVGQWRGANTYGPVQLTTGLQLTISGSGLIPGTTYQPVWSGSVVYDAQVNPSEPLSYSHDVNATTEGAVILSFPTPANLTLAPGNRLIASMTCDPAWRSVWVFVTAAAATFSPTFTVTCSGHPPGGALGVLIEPYEPAYFDPTNPQAAIVFRFPLVPGLFSELDFIVGGAGSTDTITFYVGADLNNTDIETHAAGGGSSVTIPVPTPVKNYVELHSGQMLTDALETYPVGGLSVRTTTLAPGPHGFVLPAPGFGSCYRLHRVTANGACHVDENVIGSVYCYIDPATADSSQQNLNGIINSTGVSVTVTAAANVFISIWYDLLNFIPFLN